MFDAATDHHMNFKLEKVSANKALVKFNIVNTAEELCGTVTVPPSQEADLLQALEGCAGNHAGRQGRQGGSRWQGRDCCRLKARPEVKQGGASAFLNMDGKTGLSAAINCRVLRK